jgi:hypothetical protein
MVIYFSIRALNPYPNRIAAQNWLTSRLSEDLTFFILSLSLNLLLGW